MSLSRLQLRTLQSQLALAPIVLSRQPIVKDPLIDTITGLLHIPYPLLKIVRLCQQAGAVPMIIQPVADVDSGTIID
jgi:hypothetical protein